MSIIKSIKTIFVLAPMIAAILMSGGCAMGRSESSRNVVYKEREEIEEDVKSYLKEKYEKDFVVAVTDSPNHIYSSYEVSAYAADDESKEMFDVSITYIDEENYSVTDDYFMYSISDELEAWFIELANPYIDCDFKAFWCSSPFGLSSDYDTCKTAEDFLELSPTSSYYGLRFLIVLPSQMDEDNLTTITNSIASDMLEKHIRGQVTTIAYVDKTVYDQINSKGDESCFWSYQYRNYNCCATIRGDFSFSKAVLRKAGAWNLDDKTYNERFEN